MASASQDKPAPGTIVANAIENLPVNVRTQEIGAYLNMRLTSIEEALPSNMKGEGQRLIRRAMIQFASKAELHECTVPSFLMCVVQAAELGFAIDGRLCHAVAYSCNVAPKGRPPQWEKRAQCQPDYKGLVSVAKRSRQIADCDGDIVCVGDHFKYGMVNGQNVFEFTPNPDERGEMRGAFARVVLPNGLWSVEYMNMKQLNAIREKSKSKDKGPWVTDSEQMYIKTVIRRCLKMYCDDPSFIHATEIDDACEAIEGHVITSNNSRAKIRHSTFNDRLAPPPANVLTVEPEKPTQHPSTPRSERKQKEAEQQQEETQEAEPAPTLAEEFAAVKSLKEAKAIYDRECGEHGASDEDRIAEATALWDECRNRFK